MVRLGEQSLLGLVGAIFGENKPEGMRILEQAGFARPAQAFDNLCRIIVPLDPGRQAERLTRILLEAIGDCADPDMALANWQNLFAVAFGHAAFAGFVLDDPQLAELLSRLFGHSQYLTDILLRNPEYVEWISTPEARSEKSLAELQHELADAAKLFREEPRRREAICRYHRRELVRIGLRDLMGWAPLETIMRELADLAQATVQVALAVCSARLQARFGTPLCGEGPAPCGFAVVAMGKLGGRELNYSSDIDLIFVYEAPGITLGVRDSTGHVTGLISNQEYFARLGAELIDFLSRHGPEGYLYRVDVRLRPEGSSGALAHSFAACENYYLGRARLWERIALLKARGIAGDHALIEQFERLATGFVFGPATPALLLGEVALLKERIDREVAESDSSDREIKRGRGGIREIEFIVASLQILHGQDAAQLRKRSTLEAIESLTAAGLLAADEAETLAHAYRFFRRIEHALQCMEWRRTHLLPYDTDALACLAARCGVRADTPAEAAEQFEAERRQLADTVRGFFEELFYTRAQPLLPVAEPLRLLDSSCSTDEAKGLLAQWRLYDPSLAESLRRLARGTPTMFISAAGQRRFEQLLPALLQSCRHVPWPENAIRNFESFVQASGDPNGYYSLLDNNRSILDLLIRLCGASTTLAQVLAANPGWFESLVAPETYDEKCQWLSVGPVELAERGGADPNARLRGLRDFALLGSLRLAVRYILGLASHRETAQTLSALASTCVEAATAWAWEEVAAKENLAVCDELPFTVLALGKLGRNELIFFSDLDLVFVSDHGASLKVSIPCDSYSVFTRVAERTIFYLADPQAGTAPFRVDTRLRPEGAGSPLVVSLDGLRQHFDRRGDLWEIQTYLGARPIAGSRQLGDQALRIVMSAIARFGDSKCIAEAIRSMRQRLEQTVSLPAWAAADFKRGSGGLVDLEFIAQYLQIVRASEADDLTRATPPEVFAKADEKGWLDHATTELLADNYDFLRRLELDVRLILESRQTYFPSDPARLEALTYAPARKSGSIQSLRGEFDRRAREVRNLFNRILTGLTG